MYNLWYTSKLVLRVLILSLLLISCHNSQQAKKAAKEYFIYAQDEENKTDMKMAEYLKKHLQKRCKSKLISEIKNSNTFEVYVGVRENLEGDYQIKKLPYGYTLTAKSERTLIWLLYQFIRHEGLNDPAIAIDDLPPCVFPDKDTLATFPFEYRDIYTPSNQNPDITYLLALNNIEIDWGLWGHQMNNVLGGNGEKSFSFQNMDKELFALVGGITRTDQFCFSSDKLYDLTVKYITEMYGTGEDVHYHITIAPNDNSFVCCCPKCTGAGNTPTNATPAVTRFVERLADKFPGHIFFTTSYSTTSALPHHKLPSNVGVLLSAMDYPRAYGNSESAKAQEFFHHIEEWKKLTDRVYVWDYICNFDDYYTPFPILSIMKQRLNEYHNRGVKGVFLNGSGYFYSFLQEAYCFVLSQMMIDLNADPLKLLKRYLDYTAPNIGKFVFDVLANQELYVQSNGKELPMYGGMEDILNSYIREDNFVDLYLKFIKLDPDDMSPKEKAWWKKIRQAVSMSFMEIGRCKGLEHNGFAALGEDGKYHAKQDFLNALDYLRDVTDDDELYYLTTNENATMDHMDRINEEGLYIGDYQRECDNWLNRNSWNANLLIGTPLVVKSSIWQTEDSKLTDGVMGISQNYHWGWEIFKQDKLVIVLPAEKIQDGTIICMGFLNFERHRLSPPATVSVYIDDEKAYEIKADPSNPYFDEGDVVLYWQNINFKGANKVELHFEPSAKTPFLAIDEVWVK